MTMNQHKKIWLQEQASLWKSLEGRNIKAFAVREPLDWADVDETQPVYEHPQIPFMHLAKVWFECSDGNVFKVTTTQDEDIFGLHITNEPVEKSDDRLVSIDCAGPIDKVDVSLYMDNIAMIDISFSGMQRIFIPGEVEPEWDGYIIRKMDESVLIFNNKDEYDRTCFGQSIKVDLKENQNSE